MNRPRFETDKDRRIEANIAQEYAEGLGTTLTKETDYEHGLAQWQRGDGGIVDIHAAKISRRWRFVQNEGFNFGKAKWDHLVARGKDEDHPPMLVIGWVDDDGNVEWLHVIKVGDQEWGTLKEGTPKAGRTRRKRDAWDSEDVVVIPVDKFVRFS